MRAAELPLTQSGASVPSAEALSVNRMMGVTSIICASCDEVRSSAAWATARFSSDAIASSASEMSALISSSSFSSAPEKNPVSSEYMVRAPARRPFSSSGMAAEDL